MATVTLISYEQASPEVRAVYDEIRAHRQTETINHFWQALAHQPGNLRRVWDQVKAVMGSGALDPLTKELIYLAVSITNGCSYCIHSHTAAARLKGMTAEQYAELTAVIGLAQQTNGIASALQVPVEAGFQSGN